MIHRYWYGDSPPQWTGKALRSLHSDLEVRDWSDEDLPLDVVRWLDSHSDQVRAKDFARHRANMVRFYLLNRYGGWWVDHDVVMLQRLDESPSPLVASHDGFPCLSVMGFSQDHPILGQMLERIEEANSSPYYPSSAISGSSSFSFLLQSYPDITLMPLAYSHEGVWQGSNWAVQVPLQD